jgi:CelD/BcsL family acetyltransferase involved in cellulose biosynthesis
MCDYQGLIGAPDLIEDGRRLVEALKVDRLDFSHMLADQPAFAPYLRGRELSRGVALPQGYAAYAAERAGVSGILKDLDKRRRKVQREVGPLRFEAHCRSTAAFEKLIAWKRALLRATGQTDIFEAGWPLRLLSDLFTARDPDFGAVLFTLSVGDQLAAAHLHLRSRHTIHAWIIGHDHAMDAYSPGLILFQEILRWMDDTPFSYLDFGGGDYRFKQQFSNAGREIGHGFVGRMSAATLVRSAEYGVRAAAERLDLGAVSALPGKAMRRLDLLRGLG